MHESDTLYSEPSAQMTINEQKNNWISRTRPLCLQGRPLSAFGQTQSKAVQP